VVASGTTAGIEWLDVNAGAGADMVAAVPALAAACATGQVCDLNTESRTAAVAAAAAEGLAGSSSGGAAAEGLGQPGDEEEEQGALAGAGECQGVAVVAGDSVVDGECFDELEDDLD